MEISKIVVFNSPQTAHCFSRFATKNDYRYSAMQSEKDAFIKSKSGISFSGRPWELDYSELPIDDEDAITGKEAVEVYKKFKLGNYLDIAHPESYPPLYENEEAYKRIRKHNLKFLDSVFKPSDKRVFVDYFCDLTGFPDFEEVARKMESEFYHAVKKSEANLLPLDYGYKVLAFGYDNTCSVGKKKAFPGSDLDNAYIIIDGSPIPSIDEEMINKFKGELWNNTDQRIISYNEHAAFPNVYSKRQILGLLEKMERKAGALNLGRNYEKYRSLKDKYTTDYVHANKFFIDLCKQFPQSTRTDIDVDYPNREHVKNFGFFLDTYMNGAYWGERNLDELLHDKIAGSNSARLANMLQLTALHRESPVKKKLSSRTSLQYEFPNWSVDKQFALIKTIIKASCCDEDDFMEYFSNPDNGFERLINIIRSK